MLGDRLRGLYLYSSALTPDFDLEISDIDLTAVTETLISQTEFEALDKVHSQVIATHPHWESRLEIQYQSLPELQNFKERSSTMANMSPGEPFHFLGSGRDWLTSWYFIRNMGVALYDPQPAYSCPKSPRASSYKQLSSTRRAMDP